MVLHISAYSIRCLSSTSPIISRRFVIRAIDGDDYLDFSGLLIDLATLEVLCWIMSVVVSLMVSISSSSCSVSNRFLNSSWNSIFFDPICLASTLGGLLVINVFISTSMSSLMLLRSHNNFTSLPMLTWLMTVCDDVWLACLLGCSRFRSSLRRLGFSTFISTPLSYGTRYS